MILIGAIFLFLSFSPARNILGNVSGPLRLKGCNGGFSSDSDDVEVDHCISVTGKRS